MLEEGERGLFRDSPPLSLFPYSPVLCHCIRKFSISPSSERASKTCATLQPRNPLRQPSRYYTLQIAEKFGQNSSISKMRSRHKNAYRTPEKKAKILIPRNPHGLAKARMTCRNLFVQLFANDGLSSRAKGRGRCQPVSAG